MWKYECSEENCAHVEVDSLFCSAFTRSLAQHYYYINDLFCPEQIILEEDSSVC